MGHHRAGGQVEPDQREFLDACHRGHHRDGVLGDRHGGQCVGDRTSRSYSTAGALVTVTAGGLSGRRGDYQVPLTVTADNASNGTGVGQASVSLQIFASAQCSGAPEASGSATTASNGRAGLTFTTRIAGTWCALATVTASGYTSASGQTSFNT